MRHRTLDSLGHQSVARFEMSVEAAMGFSMGGMVVQEFVLANSDLVRRVILAGTALAGGDNLGFTPDVTRAAANPVNTREDFLYLFFGPSATSQAAGKAFWERRHQRTKDGDPPSPDRPSRP